MATIESLEALLAEAAQCLDDAAGELRELPQLDAKQNLRRIGTAMNAVWEFRDEVYKLRPDLKPMFVTEYETDHERYDQLYDRSNEAHRLEAAGEFDLASEAFSALRAAAKRGYFCMQAEAGLFRIAERQGTSPDNSLERTREEYSAKPEPPQPRGAQLSR
jgi:hypothetical protein